VIENPKNNFKIFLVSKRLSSHVQYKLQNQPRPKVTDYILSVIQHLLMQDGWCVDREYIPMYSCPIANIMFMYTKTSSKCTYLPINHQSTKVKISN
jgi:hypothetical protein